MEQKVIKAGNSTAVTVPAKFVKSIGIKIGDMVKVETIPEKGRIIYTFKGARQLSLTGNFFKRKMSSKEND